MVRRGLRPTILYTGPSKTGGKSTTAAYHALQMGPNLIWVDLTPSPLDGVRRWAKKLDGRLLLLDLPDVEFSSDSKDSLQYRQEELYRQDEQNVESFLKELTDQWELNGHISDCLWLYCQGNCHLGTLNGLMPSLRSLES